MSRRLVAIAAIGAGLILATIGGLVTLLSLLGFPDGFSHDWPALIVTLPMILSGILSVRFGERRLRSDARKGRSEANS